MPAIHVSEEIIIEKPVAEVFDHVRDFEKWPEWSPWLICEPDTQLTFQKDAYSWEGEIVGLGKMSINDVRPNKEIAYDLNFFKPWKSHADVRMQFAEAEQGTRVTWVMDSSLPWFMFFMKPMMECMVGMDYQRGLRMLKEVLETGDLNSELSYNGRVPVSSCDYLGINRTCSMSDMEDIMGEDFEKISTLYADRGNHDEPMFTIYNKWNMSKGEVNYTVCCPTKKPETNIPNGMAAGRREACEVFAVTHKGPYKHLGNAWSAAMMRARSKVFKQSKKVLPFEQYISDPNATEEAEILTRVCLPRKD